MSHGDVIKSILSHATGAQLDDFQRINVDPASVSVVRYTSRKPFVLRLNDVGGDLGGSAPAGAAVRSTTATPRSAAEPGAHGGGPGADGPDPVG